MSHHKNLSILLRSPKHLFSFFKIESQWFFNKDMFSSFQGLYRKKRMASGESGHNNSINIWILQNILDIICHLNLMMIVASNSFFFLLPRITTGFNTENRERGKCP